MKTLFRSIAFAALLPIAGTAAAQTVTIDAPDTVSAVVPAADLNLATPAGRETLRGRVRLAAGKLCGAPVLPLHQMQARSQCRSEVIASAETQLRSAAAPASVQVLGTR